MSAKRIGILTGGGDVPGLNSVIKTVVYRGSEIGCEVIGIRRGWEGLTHVNLEDPASRTRYVLPLNRENTRTIDRTGGTYLHSSRTNPSKMKKLPPVLEGQDFPVKESTKKGVTSTVYDVTRAVLKNIETLDLDYLIAIGGDDTLSYAAELDRQGMQRRSPCRRPWTTTCGTPNTASDSPPPSRAPWTPSSGSAPPSARTSASAFSASSAAMPATPRSTPPTSLRCAAAFRNTRWTCRS